MGLGAHLKRRKPRPPRECLRLWAENRAEIRRIALQMRFGGFLWRDEKITIIPGQAEGGKPVTLARQGKGREGKPVSWLGKLVRVRARKLVQPWRLHPKKMKVFEKSPRSAYISLKTTTQSDQ